jgi:phytoene dehydrogenase-like protein
MIPQQNSYDAIVIGSGPNGLAAAITMSQAGRSVLVVEGQQTIGGGTRSAELTLPGFLHDVCSAVHPLGFGSPFFRTLPLTEHGLAWIEPSAALAHPFDDGTAVCVERSIERTAENLGAAGSEYSGFMAPLVAAWPKLESTLLGPLGFPAHPAVATRFGLLAMRSLAQFLPEWRRIPRCRWSECRARRLGSCWGLRHMFSAGRFLPEERRALPVLWRLICARWAAKSSPACRSSHSSSCRLHA